MSVRMPRVSGIGGIFFKSANPGKLADWYRQHLDIPVESWGGAIFHSRPLDSDQPAYTVWSPFPESTRYFAPSTKEFMLNLRVDNLDAVLAALRQEGCQVLDRREDTEQGRFGYVVDPDGLLIELWQPSADDSALAK